MEKYEQLRNMRLGRHRVASQRGYTNIFFNQKGKDVHKYYQILKMKTILDLQVLTIFKSLKFNHSRFPWLIKKKKKTKAL